MSVFVLAVLALAAVGLKIPARDSGYDPLSRDETTAIRGLFILMIFLTHSAQYLTVTRAPWETPYWLLRLGCGQGVVTMFFFYSGFGILEAIRKKGKAYLRAFPKNRFLRTLVHFDIAVLLFLLLAIVQGRHYHLQHILFAFTGWTAIGNSNWFMFDIFVAYALTFLAFSVAGTKKPLRGTVVLTALAFGFVVLLRLTHRDDSMYNTFLCFPAGMWFSLCRPKLRAVYDKHPVLLTVGAVAAYVGVATVCYNLMLRKKDFQLLYCVAMLLFVAMILVLTARVKIGNRVLLWYGKVSFSVFILMRLPMLVLRNSLHLNRSLWVFVPLAFAATTLLAFGYDKLLGLLDNKLFFRKQAK